MSSQNTGTLVHEIAHVRRYDNLVNLLQRLVETVFFFHPAVWWVSNCIRVEREHCCDDVAVAGRDPRLFAETLTTLEELRSPILAAAATGDPLLSRVRRLLSLDGSSARGMSGFASGLLTILVIMATGAVTLHATLSANQIEEKEMASELKSEPSRKVLDTKRTKVWTRIIASLHDMLQAAGETEWSVPRLQGVMGNGFSFEMRKGGGAVWQEGNLDWWLVFESRFEEDLGCRIQRFQVREDTDEAESKRVMTEAWDAVRASIDRGVPVAAWAPMYEDDEPNDARDWAPLVGYDEAKETYVVRRSRTEFDCRYDEIGQNGRFLVLVYQGPEPGDHSGIHIKALRNAVALANGTRYDADKAPIKVDARGIAAFDLWLDAMKSGAEPDPQQRSPRSEGFANDSREHAGWLASNRRYVADYLRELVEVFPAAADLLTDIAEHYDRVAEMAGRLHTLCDDASKSGGFTPETRIQASSVLAGAMDNEMAALRHMEKALRRIDPQFEPTALREEIGTEAPGSRPSGGRRVELDIAPEENYGGSILSVLPPALQAAGRDWSTEFIRGYLGLGFVFSMYEGGGRIWHRENYEWDYFWGTLPDLRAISAHLSGDIGPHKEPVTPEKHAQTKAEAWDAVRASIDAGIPAIVMNAMNKEMEESGKKPYMWSLIVGYDEAAGTYIGHHNDLGKFTIGWDDFGHVGSAQWFCVMVVEPGSKPFDDLKAHRRVIRRAIEASQGKRPANFEDATAYGLAAWEMWLDGFRKETIDVSAIKYHTSFLETSRNSAAVYLEEIEPYFSEGAKGPLREAVEQYEAVTDAVKELHELANGQDFQEKPNLKKGARILAKIMEHERLGLDKLQEVLDESYVSHTNNE